MQCHSCTSYNTEMILKEVDLDKVALVTTKVLCCRDCKDEHIGYENIDQLMDTVALELCKFNRRLLPHELRWLRKHAGISLASWADYIDVLESDIDSWENGETPFPKAVEKLLKVMVCNDLTGTSVHTNLIDSPIRLYQNTTRQWVRL